MTKKAAATFLYPLFVLCVCLLICFGYRVHNSQKQPRSPAAAVASNQTVAVPGKAVRRPPRWLAMPSPHENLQNELRKSEANVRRNPHDPDAHFEYADALDAAIEQYRLALKFPPKDYGRAYLYLGLGIALEKKGDMDGALAALRKSVASWPTKHERYCRMYEREALGQLRKTRATTRVHFSTGKI